MLSKLAKLTLVSTSLAPVLVTYAFVEYLDPQRSSPFLWISLIIITISLVFLCWWVIGLATKKLGELDFRIKEAKSADSEIVGFILVYLSPLIGTSNIDFSTPILIFVLFLLVFVIWSSNAYHFNPLLGLSLIHI